MVLAEQTAAVRKRKPAFVQQCLKEQVERVASARVDIMVEAEQLGFDLPTAEPTLMHFVMLSSGGGSSQGGAVG